MARVFDINEKIPYRTSTCPICLRIVPPASIVERGLKCPRCGIVPWEKARELDEKRKNIYQSRGVGRKRNV